MTDSTLTTEKDAEPLSDHYDAAIDYEFNRQIRERLNESVNAALEQVSPKNTPPIRYRHRLIRYARDELYATITENDIDGYSPPNLTQWLTERVDNRRLPANGSTEEWSMTGAFEGRYTWKTDEGGYIRIMEYEPGLWGLYHGTPESRNTDEGETQFTGTTKQVRKTIESIFAGEEIVLPDRVRQ